MLLHHCHFSSEQSSSLKWATLLSKCHKQERFKIKFLRTFELSALLLRLKLETK